VAERLRCVKPNSIVVGWDFSTGGVKALAFDLAGKVLAHVRLPTDLWNAGGVSELSLMQLEGQAHASVRALVAELDRPRLDRWVAAGISATHHTAGRIDTHGNQVRRAICWNDHSLAPYHARGLERLGGQEKVIKAVGGPWAIRYTLSHLIKDEETLPLEDWKRTFRILPHGPLAAGYLTGNFDVTSVSAAASTGLMNLKTCKWSPFMLGAISDPRLRQLAKKQLPEIIEDRKPVGYIHPYMLLLRGWRCRPPLVAIFPTSDDQAAGLVGGGAVDAGQMAIILGNSAVVNSSSSELPQSGTLDAMRLNWGPYLWMRCYNNGAQFLDRVVGPKPDWAKLEADARKLPPGSNGVGVLPFANPEPSLAVSEPKFRWFPQEPEDMATKYRASLEALAYLIALGVAEHEAAGQKITRITVSGGIARSNLMCEILATVLDRPLHRLQSDEGPALGAAVTALAALEASLRRQKKIKEPYTVADAVSVLVKFRDQVEPNQGWRETYQMGLQTFRERLGK
jgi:xylulokinase